MAISDIYTGTSTSAVSSTSITAIAQLATGANKRAFVVGVRIGIGATSVTSGSTLFQLFRNTGAGTGGTTANATTANDSAAPASLATFSFAAAGTWTLAPTGNVSCLWQQELPNTTGSSWEEFPPLGYEYTIPVNSGVSLWVTQNGTAASQNYYVEMVWSE